MRDPEDGGDMRELPADWWGLTDDELRECQIAAQPECAECGGQCCAPGKLWAEVPADTTLVNMRERVEAQGYPVARMRGVMPVGGRMMAKFDCAAFGGICEVDPKPEVCRKFPLPWLRSDTPDGPRGNVRALCPLFRRLEAEREASRRTGFQPVTYGVGQDARPTRRRTRIEATA